MKKITIILLVFIALLFSACSSTAVDNASKEASDQLQNISNKNNKYVLMVKDGHPTDYPDVTYGKSFDNFFGSPTWKYFKSDDGRDVVEFTGDCTYRESKVKARLQFILKVDDGTFEAGALSFNEVPQENVVTLSLLGNVFKEEQEKMSKAKEAEISKIEKKEKASDDKNDNINFQKTPIDQAAQRKINIFMSNFAEVPFDMSFKEDNISDRQLILFGFWHYYRNHGMKEPYFQFEKPYCKISKKYIEQAVKKYYNISKINHQTIPIDKNYSYEYKNRYYYFMPAEGECPIDYSVVYRIDNIGQNKYYIYAKEYHGSENTTKLPLNYDYYGLNYDKAEKIYKDEMDVYTVKMVKAKVEKIKENGKERYILLEYAAK
ncbi:hypothetical protein ACFIJ5_10510 [Haloimpatiens sp. FM7330]|uniref:hypothetical protein n=1 Tax=Haloimpatiens sp. FM7330 TaxID=3298610 RepID=UPI00363AF1E7